jgi:hypothetical protein
LQRPVRGEKNILRYVERNIRIADHSAHVASEFGLMLAHEGIHPSVRDVCLRGGEVDLLHSLAPFAR